MNQLAASEQFVYVTPAQLCIGLFVHLDLPWTDHPFTFSSFKIKSLDQIHTLQSLGLEQIRYTPGKSDGSPLPAPESPPPTVASSRAPDDPAFAIKRQRLDQLTAQRAKIKACEGALLNSARTVKSITKNLFARPAAAQQQAESLVQSMAASMLVDADIAIHLMADKVGGEEVYDHALNVMLLSMMLARELKVPATAIKQLGLGAIFHDVGTHDLPERVTRKGEVLSKAEQGVFQQHSASGVEIGKKLGLSAEALQVILQHHEAVDGSGYPKRLKGPQISLLAKIVTIASDYDDLCNPANPAKAFTPHEALSIMYGQQRVRYDNAALMTFVRCMGIYPPGTIVVLSNGTIGMVTSVNSTRPLKPSVLVYDPNVPRDEAMLVDLEKEPDVVVSKTMRPQQLTDEMHAYLAPRKRVTYYFDAESRKRGS
ncbi:HD-GYP domain-containing protein [Aquabacterium sp.]|uniref:HD-GYP domain-containing protein n=1 Tax=Aquabacterium sp. TaxID=1872578 RepID=UPI0035B3001C